MPESDDMPPAALKRKRSYCTGLELATITDEVANEGIKCTCEDGIPRPPNGHAVLRCGQCSEWQHYNCVLRNKETSVSPAELRGGFVCIRCRADLRSTAALPTAASKRQSGVPSKRAVVGDMVSEALSTPAKLPSNVSSSQRHIASDHTVHPDAGPRTKMVFQLPPLVPGVQSCYSDGEEASANRLAESDGIPRTRMVFKLPVARGKAARVNVDENAVATRAKNGSAQEAHNGSGFLATGEKPMPNFGQSTEHLPPVETLHEVIEQWKNATKRPTVSCDCQLPALDGKVTNYIICYSCRRLQHKACMQADKTGGGQIPGPLCLNCKRLKYAELMKQQAAKVQSAKLAYEEARRRKRAAEAQRHARFKEICANYLWKHYCSLPDGNASATVQNLSRMHYANGQMLPLHSAPRSWLVAVDAAVVKLRVAAAGLLHHVCGRDGAALSMNDPDRLLRTLRELAVLVIHHGPHKGERHQLGVLAELLGLAEKGAFWKG